MTDNQTLGNQIALHRRRLGLSQSIFAAQVDRSESWVSQVERGARTIDRLSVLQKVADVLGVSVAELRGTDGEPPAQEEERPEAIEQLRLALSGHPALQVIVRPSSEAQIADSRHDDLRILHSQVWPLVHSARYGELAPILVRLIPGLEEAARIGDRREESLQLLSDTYQATAAALAKIAEGDAAWIAADRAAFVAEMLPDALLVAASHFRAAHVFVSLRQLSQAQHVAELAANTLEPLTLDQGADLRAMSVYGALNLVLSVIAARDNDRATAYKRLKAAEQVAERIGGDRNDFGTEFGPTNVALHSVSIAVDLGDAGTALDLARSVDASSLSSERQARFLVDIARAQTMRRQIGEAMRSIERAEEVAPEQVRTLKPAREVVRDLIQLAGTHARPELRSMAERFDVL